MPRARRSVEGVAYTVRTEHIKPAIHFVVHFVCVNRLIIRFTGLIVGIRDHASTMFQHGNICYPSNFAGTPGELLKEICRQVDQGRLQKVHIVSTMVEGGAPWDDPKFYGDGMAGPTRFCVYSTVAAIPQRLQILRIRSHIDETDRRH
ncbi:unnamed protein product [Toxocara canis]|uniref:NAD_binding_4 domain-containing protein n=1 Tax=Toxocara canis TaxID=6265 RepID=A0A183U0R4_TOXCA|nr:unnamed protein product [Toxocara canis]